MKRFLRSVSLQHEPKASDLITLVKKTFFARVSYEILYHEVCEINIINACFLNVTVNFLKIIIFRFILLRELFWQKRLIILLIWSTENNYKKQL